jgi:small-conductance mechanosensitive channel
MFMMPCRRTACENPGLTREQLAMWSVPALAFGLVALAGLALRHLALRAIDRHVTNKRSLAFIASDVLRMPSIFWCIAAGLAVGLRWADAAVGYWAQKGIGAFTILSIALVTAAIGVRMIALYGERAKMPFAVAGLSRTLTYILVFSIAGLMLLRLFDITITPILTAFGVGGLAVALALQDTLSNFFAGVHILVEEPISVGDFVRLGSGEEGVVRDIGWRTTRLHTFGNNIIVVPNTKITSSILTNYSLPEKRGVAEVTLIAAHHADPDSIAAIAMDAAAETRGVLEEPAPSVLFDPGVLPTHIQMKLIVHVPDRIERGRIQKVCRCLRRLHPSRSRSRSRPT